MKLIVKTSSANLWWGIYGFCEKIGWEDLTILNDNGEKIGAFCLNAKRYLRDGVEDLRNDESEHEFVQAVDKYLADDKIHYWYFYNEPHYTDFFEVPYEAPRNLKGEKPRYIDLWHPDERVDISTIQSSVRNFAETFLNIPDVEIQIDEGPGIEKSLEAFKEYRRQLGTSEQVKIDFSDD